MNCRRLYGQVNVDLGRILLEKSERQESGRVSRMDGRLKGLLEHARRF
jgi:hypothetical protein